MKRKKLIGILSVIAFIILGFFIWYKSSNPKITPSTHTTDSIKNYSQGKDSNSSSISASKLSQQKDSIPENWKTYSDDKMGISFQHPGSWVKQGKDAEIMNLSGTIIKKGIYFSDSSNQTRVSIEYSLDSNAVKIYEYAESQFISSQKSALNNSRKFLVDGSEAIEISKEFKVNGKGKTLSPPMRILIVDFMDKNKKGEIQIQFQTPLSNEQEEENNFKKLLSSFKFINNE